MANHIAWQQVEGFSLIGISYTRNRESPSDSQPHDGRDREVDLSIKDDQYHNQCDNNLLDRELKEANLIADLQIVG